MKSILLIGLGRFGTNLAKKLHAMGHEIMAVESREARVDDAMPYVTNAIIADAANENFLKGLGIPDFDICFVAIGTDFQSSLEVTMMLKDLGAKEVIARASSEFHEKFLKRNGADVVVYPEKQIADWTATIYSSEKIMDYAILHGNLGLFEMKIPEEWIGKTVHQLDVRRKYNISIAGIKQFTEINVNVNADTVIPKDATMLVLGQEEKIRKCFRI